MIFAIIMATFHRSNGSTPDYLHRSIRSVLSQTYDNWHLIIVGDDYQPESELLEIIKFYQNTTDEIAYLKNTRSERSYVSDRHTLWRVGGANAINIGLEYIREKGYQYYAHLDDDDYWSPDHLITIATAYKKYPNCIFVNTQSQHKQSYLPKKKLPVRENNLIPARRTMNHSSISFRVDIIPFQYQSSLHGEIVHQASDAHMLDQIGRFLRQHTQYTSVYIPKLTCFHPTEGMTVK